MPSADRSPTGQLTGQPTGSQQKETGPANRPRGGPAPDQRGVRRAAIYRCLVDRGLHARGTAEALNLPWTTVRRAVDFLLKNGAIREQGGPSKGRTAYRFFEPGPVDWTGLDRVTGGGSGPAPILGAHIHRGRRSLGITSPPADPKAGAGWVRSWTASGVPNHLYEWRDAEGALWKFQAILGRKSQQRLQVFPPPVMTSDPDVVATVNDGWWNDRAMKAAHTWAQKSDYLLERERAAIRESQPAEVALPDAGVPKFGTPGATASWGDSTPTTGTWETQDPKAAASVMVLPGRVQAIEAAQAELRRDFASLLTVVGEGIAVTAQVRDGMTGLVRMTTNVAQSVAALVPSIQPSLPSPPGVESA